MPPRRPETDYRICVRCDKRWHKNKMSKRYAQSNTHGVCCHCAGPLKNNTNGRYCALCAGLPWRVHGEACLVCGLRHAEQVLPSITDVTRNTDVFDSI